MKVACLTGSRADAAAITAVHKALLKHGVDACIEQIAPSGDITTMPPNVDLVVVEGDRFEILKAVTNCFLMKLPIVHLGGGDITEGSQDDSMRHAITKLSHLHFVTNEAARKRVIQLGESPLFVKVVGEPGIDELETNEKEIATKLVGAEDYILVVWHPNTLVSEDQAVTEVTVVAEALEQIKMKKLFIGPNGDSGGYRINIFLEGWAVFTEDKYVRSLPRDMYLTVLKHAKALVGNSSSGYYEAPSFGTPVLDIGDRQKGRIKPVNVDHAPIDANKIKIMIQGLIDRQKYIPANLYATGHAADTIAKEIAKLGQPGHDPKKLIRKTFYAINH